jgi:type IV pilus assembly protein PilE
MRHTARGFTLIEVMIVVVVVAILASLGIPGYREYMRRTDRAEAKAALMQNAQFLERVRTMSNRYDLDGGGAAITSASLPVPFTPTNGTAKYNITLVHDPMAPGVRYVLNAVPVGGGPMDGDGCGTFTLSETGAKALTGNSYPLQRCWNR